MSGYQGFYLASTLDVNEGVSMKKTLLFLMSALMWSLNPAWALECLDVLTSTESKTITVNDINNPEAFFEAMTKGMILKPHQEGLFGFYRTVFGDSSTDVGKDLEAVYRVLDKYPSLLDEQILFKEVHLNQIEKKYPVPDKLKTFTSSLLKSMGRTRANLFYTDTNLGFWKKILMPPLEKETLNSKFKRRLDSLIPIELRNQLKETNADNFSENTKLLFNALHKYEKWLVKRNKSQKQINKIRQALVDLIHSAPFFNASLVKSLKSDSGLDVLSALKKLFNLRDQLSMEFGFENHFIEVTQKYNSQPTRQDLSSDLLTDTLRTFEEEILKLPFKEVKTSLVRVRPLSIIESPFRSCLGGGDCSSQVYFEKALDPNFYYFTMTDEKHLSSGHVTIVLGEARDSTHTLVKTAFIDKIQNIDNKDLFVVLEAIRRSVEDKGFLLALPKSIGNANDLSITETTRSFVKTELLPLQDKDLRGFKPFKNDYDFSKGFSRSHQSLALSVLKPIEDTEQGKFSLKHSYANIEAPKHLTIDVLTEDIMKLGESSYEKDLLQFIALSERVNEFTKYGFDDKEYWQKIIDLFETTDSQKVKKQSFYALILLKGRIDLADRSNFSSELWQHILGEVIQWGKSSKTLRKKTWEAWANDSSIDSSLQKEIRSFIEAPWFNKDSAFVWASQFGHVDVVERLLREGAHVNAKDSRGDTALIWASYYGHADVVERLLREGAHVNAKDSDGYTALIWASYYGYVDVVERLLREGAHVNAKTSDKNTALLWASYNGHTDVVERLLRESAHVNTKDSDKNTALLWASYYGHTDVVERILKHKDTDVNAENSHGDTALIWASRFGHVDIVKQILKQKGIDVNAKNPHGETALTLASHNGQIDLVELLLKHKDIDVNAKTKSGDTALIWASYYGHADVVERILKHKNINVNAKDSDGHTALIWASMNGHADVVKRILKHKDTDVNAEGSNGYTALIWASYYGYVDIVKRILKQKDTDVNAKTSYGYTALMLASWFGHVDVVKLLLKQKGISVSDKDSVGNTALMLASRDEHTDVVERISEYIKQFNNGLENF